MNVQAVREELDRCWPDLMWIVEPVCGSIAAVATTDGATADEAIITLWYCSSRPHDILASLYLRPAEEELAKQHKWLEHLYWILEPARATSTEQAVALLWNAWMQRLGGLPMPTIPFKEEPREQSDSIVERLDDDLDIFWGDLPWMRCLTRSGGWAKARWGDIVIEVRVEQTPTDPKTPYQVALWLEREGEQPYWILRSTPYESVSAAVVGARIAWDNWFTWTICLPPPEVQTS